LAAAGEGIVSEAPDALYGSDVVVAMLRAAGIRHLALNPGATTSALHESAAEPGSGLDLVLCCHEEIAVAVAHGYAKASGTPMAVALHNVVGLQHAAMAIFNAWCDRAPMILLGGTGPMAEGRRRPGIDWVHTANLQGQAVRDSVKWDVQVFDRTELPGALAKAIEIAQTPPCGPVYVCIDWLDQVEEYEGTVPADALAAAGRDRAWRAQPLGEDVERVRTLLEDATLPVIVTGRTNPGHDRSAIEALVAVAERWSVPVIDLGARLNFPTQHPLCLSECRDDLLADADLVLALDVHDLHAALTSRAGITRGPGASHLGAAFLVDVTCEPGPRSSWLADDGPWRGRDMRIDVPGRRLLDALLEGLAPEATSRASERLTRLAALRDGARAGWEAELEQGWDAVPISTGRLSAELGTVIGDDPWLLANNGFVRWPLRLWPLDGDRPHIGASGGDGQGYGLPASVGAAFACKETGRVAVDIQGDGDLMYVSSALWTAARYELPLLVVLHNNRSYHQDKLHQISVSGSRGRGRLSTTLGIDLIDPAIDFAGLARSMGVWATGPVVDPGELGGELAAAYEYVRDERRPALVDVVCEGR
jgi:thiamine pyrophosphate-dependent acetolactate synthase large subunit-like protein